MIVVVQIIDRILNSELPGEVVVCQTEQSSDVHERAVWPAQHEDLHQARHLRECRGKPYDIDSEQQRAPDAKSAECARDEAKCKLLEAKHRRGFMLKILQLFAVRAKRCTPTNMMIGFRLK